MQADEITIDWGSAEVKVSSNEALQLEVDLHPDPSSFWLSAFGDGCQGESPGVGPSGDWWVNAPFHNRLTVGGVEPGSEERVKEALDQMAEVANRRAPNDRQEWEEKTRRKEESVRAREVAAKKMTEQFRAGSSS